MPTLSPLMGAEVMPLLLRYKLAKVALAGLALLWLATLLWGLQMRSQRPPCPDLRLMGDMVVDICAR